MGAYLFYVVLACLLFGGVLLWATGTLIRGLLWCDRKPVWEVRP